MRVLLRHSTATMFATAALLPMACGDSTGPAGVSIAVGITTTGAAGDLDPNGYTLIVNSGPTPRVVGINSLQTIVNLAAGTYAIRLDGLASNCTVNGPNPQTVALADGETAQLSFSVICSARVGTIRLTTTTTGAEIDSDGYTISIPGYASGTIESNGSRDLPNVPTGTRPVVLFGVAGNCVVSGTNPRTVSITPGSTVEVAFVIQCVTGAVLSVTTTTTGIEPDMGGYLVRLSPTGRSGPASSSQVASIGTTMLPRVLPGTYKMEVLDIAANCDAITPNPGNLTLVTGNGNELTIEIRCDTPRQLAFFNHIGPSGDIYTGFSSGGAAMPVTTTFGEDLEPAWSPDGTRLAFTSFRDGNYEIYLIGANGTGTVRLTSTAAHDRFPAWSPDGTKIAFMSERDGNPEIYVMNSNGTNPVRLTNETTLDSEPAWSPDGTRIAFRSERGGSSGIWLMRPDGTGLSRLTSNSRPEQHPAWSPDGSRIAFSRGVSNAARDIFIINSDGSGLTALTEGLEEATNPAWSPDGRKIAFGLNTYYYFASIAIYSLNGIAHTPPATMSPGFDPSWRP